MGLEHTEEAQMRCGADGDPKEKVPCGMTRVSTPTMAGPFSSLDTHSSMAFNHDWLVDPRGDPVGERQVSPTFLMPLWARPVEALHKKALLTGSV